MHALSTVMRQKKEFRVHEQKWGIISLHLNFFLIFWLGNVAKETIHKINKVYPKSPDVIVNTPEMVKQKYIYFLYD